MKWGIKFRPINQHSPHLNGQVERTQPKDLDEFQVVKNIDELNLSEKLQEWQHYWNWKRPHSALEGISPLDKWFEFIKMIPSLEKVGYEHEPANERFRLPNYHDDLKVGKLK